MVNATVVCQAQTVDKQGRIVPSPGGSEEIACETIHKLLSKDSEVLFLKEVPIDPKKMPVKWHEFVCPSNCKGKIDTMTFTKGQDPSISGRVTPGYFHDTSFVETGSFYTELKMPELLKQWGTSCKKTFQQPTSDQYYVA